MTAIRPSLDYTDRDFDSLVARAGQLITAAFPEWDQETVADFQNILVEMMCFIGDVDSFYLNKQGRETRWTQAQLRRNLLSLVKMMNYTPGGRSAATVDQTFTLSAPALAAVRLPAGTQVSTLDVTAPISYQLLTELVIPPGTTSATATVENSEFETDVFTSSGAANQSFTLTRTPYIPGTLSVTADNGTFIQVANFLNSSQTDRHFVVVVDENDRARVDFGNGINGAIPAGTLSANYKTGGGSAGRVEAGALRKLQGVFTDDNGNQVTISTTNALRSSAGGDRQTNASIKQLAPLDVHVSNRTVARPDYETVAKKLNNLVSRALMLTKSENPGIPVNAGYLLLVPPGAGDLPDSTITAVQALFEQYPYAPSFNLTIQGAPYLSVDIFARIYLAKGVLAATAKANILSALSAFFEDRVSDPTSDDFGADNPRIDFGWKMQDANGNPTNTLAFTDIENVIRDAAGVLKLDPSSTGVTINGRRADVAIGLMQFPKLGTVTLVDGLTGQTL